MASCNSKPRMPNEFLLVRTFFENQFKVKHLLSSSDTETLKMQELLSMADEECKALWENLGLGYTQTSGHSALRAEIAKLHGVAADHVLTIVPAEGVYVGLKCLVIRATELNDGKPIHAIATYPCYQSLHDDLAWFGCETDKWMPDLGSDGWWFDLAKLQGLIRPETRVLVVNFPHNPTGAMPSLDVWKKLIKICAEREIFLFSDEIYRFSDTNGAEALPSAASLYENCISLSALSKTFGMPGLRSGWLCTKNSHLMTMLATYKDYTTVCAVAPGEILSLIALRNHDRLLRDHTLPILRRNLDALDTFFARHGDEFEWHRPVACTVTLVKLKGWLLHVGAGGGSGLCQQLLDEGGVFLVPGTMFQYSDEYVRFGFCRKNLPEVLDLFEAFLAKKRPAK